MQKFGPREWCWLAAAVANIRTVYVQKYSLSTYPIDIRMYSKIRTYDNYYTYQVKDLRIQDFFTSVPIQYLQL